MAQLSSTTVVERFTVKPNDDPRPQMVDAVEAALNALPAPEATRFARVSVTCGERVLDAQRGNEFEAVASLSY